MRRTVTLLVLLLIAATTSQVSMQSWTPPAGSPMANREHPRIWLTNANLPSIRARMATGGSLHNDAVTWVAWLDSNFKNAWSPSEHAGATLHYAFAYQLLRSGNIPGLSFAHSAAEYAVVARDMFFAFAALDSGNISYDSENVIATFDWILPTLSAADRAAAFSILKTVDKMTDDGNPFVTTQVARRSVYVLAGVACVGDGLDDAWCLDHAAQYRPLFREQTGVTRAESDLVGDDGGAGQGISYGFGHTMRRTLLAEEGFRTASGASIASHYGGSDTRFLRTQPMHFAYRVLPWGPSYPTLAGGRHFRFEKGAYMNAGAGVQEHEYAGWLNAVAGIYQTIDPNESALATWLIENRTGPAAGHWGILMEWVFCKFIAGPASPIVPASPAALRLPISRRFAEGRFVFRGDWNDINVPMVSMYVNEWHRSPYGMSPFMPGGFEIHRKGPQVINQGGVSGHDWGGSGRAGSSNILIFPDSTQAAATSDNDDEGGHRRAMAKMTGSHDFVQNTAHDELDTLRYQLADGAARDFDYVYADVTRGYNSTRYNDNFNPARVSEVVRQLVYFRSPESSEPAIVVVMDRATTTDTKFEKRWLFHTAGEPIVNGSAQAGVPVRGHGNGHFTYTGATRVTATNTVNGSDGRTFLTPLLPSGSKIVKIGGPDSTGKSWTATSHEYEDPFGKFYPYAAPDVDRQQYVGQYRIEIIPSAASLSDVFLNVIEVADASAGGPTPTASLTASGLVAARVGDRIAVFNRVTADVVNGSFTVDQAGKFRILLADMTPGGEYDVTIGSSSSRQTASTAGTLYIEQAVVAGTRVDLRFTGNVVAPPPPAAPTNVRLIQ